MSRSRAQLVADSISRIRRRVEFLARMMTNSGNDQRHIFRETTDDPRYADDVGRPALRRCPDRVAMSFLGWCQGPGIQPSPSLVGTAQNFRSGR